MYHFSVPKASRNPPSELLSLSLRCRAVLLLAKGMLGVLDVGEAGVRVGEGLERWEFACTAAVVGFDDGAGCFVATERAGGTDAVGDVTEVGEAGCGERVPNCEDWAVTVVVTEGVVVAWKVEWARKAERKLYRKGRLVGIVMVVYEIWGAGGPSRLFETGFFTSRCRTIHCYACVVQV